MGNAPTNSVTTHIVILAAGRGTRMNSSNIPKVLALLKGRPLIRYLLDAIHDSGICHQPVIVVGENYQRLKEALGDDYQYVIQLHPLGTGDAVRAAQPLLQGRADHLIVLYGDHPFVSAQTLRKLALVHQTEEKVLTMMTTFVEDYDGWRTAFYHYGRIVRDPNGKVIGVVEYKDADESLRAKHKVNPGFYCFQASWLWEHLPKLQADNTQKEYYITDLVKMAIEEGEEIASIDIDPLESLGINTLEELQLAEQLL